MAQIRRVVPSTQVSDFRQAAPDAGGGFRLLAGAFDEIYKRLEPIAMAEEAEKGEADFRGMAKAQIVGNPVYASSSGGDFRSALRASESGGRVGVVNSEGFGGLYQWGQPRLDDYNRATGQNVSMAEFLQSADVQERAQDWHEADILSDLGGYVGKTAGGIPLTEGAIIGMAHLGGTEGARKFIETDGAYNPSDSNGTSLSDYGRRFAGDAVTKSSSGSPEAQEAFVPTMLRDADGKLVSKLYDPSAGPILQAYNAAAGVAYQSEIFLKASTDLMGMREQFLLDPDGFRQAAESYMDGIIEQAPELFQSDIRAGLQKEVQQTFLGILDAKHSDIRQRAANSNMALAEKWSDSLAAAIVGGDPKEIAGARSQLGSALAVRERLPGQSWTPEQSDNVMRKAEEEGQRRIATARKDQETGWKKMLSTITDAAKAGLSAADESILDNPQIQALLPEEWREAMAFTTLRDQMPSFMKMTPKDQAAAMAEMKPTVQEDWEVDLFGAAEKAAADNAKAWATDPIKRAGEVLDEKPAPMPDLENIQALPEWLASRAAYGQRLADEGFTPKPVYVSQEEATALGALFGKDVPADLKMGALTAVVGAMGPDAMGFFDQISMTDKTVRAAGMTLAAGVDPTVAQDALVGRQRLDEGLVQAPDDKAVMGAFSTDMRAAIEAVPGASGMFGEMKELAVSIYAASIPPNAPPGEQKDAMAKAWNRAMGQSETTTGTRGGIQDVGGSPVWLAPSMNGEEMTSALDAAFGRDVPIWVWADDVAGDASLWAPAAGGSMPTVEGQPITPEMWSRGNISMVPEGGNLYRLQIVYPDGTRSDVRADGTDAPFIFDADALVSAWRVKQ